MPPARKKEEMKKIRARIGREIIDEKKHPTTGEKRAFAGELGVELNYIYQVLREDYADDWRKIKMPRGPFKGRKRARKD